MSHTTAAAVVLVCSVISVPSSFAQGHTGASGFISANAGIQEGPQHLSIAVPVVIFGDSGTLDVDDGLIGGAVFDVSGGLRGRRFAFGVGFARERTDGSLDFHAGTTPPSPGSFTRSINGITPNLEHTERTVYLFAGATKQVTDRFDVMVSGGPAFIQVSQALPSGITLNPSETAVQSVATRVVDDSALGLHGALDLNYMFHPRIGIGGVVRYTWGTVEWPDATKKMTLGGVHLGAGVRVRF